MAARVSASQRRFRCRWRRTRPTVWLPQPAVGGRAAQDALEKSAARIALIFRAGWSVLTPFLAYPQALAVEGGVRPWQHVAVASTVCWGGIYAYLLQAGRIRPWVAVADTTLFCAYLVAASWILPAGYVGDPMTWIVGGASVSIFVLSWSLTPIWTVVLAVGTSGAFLAGVVLAGNGVIGGYDNQAVIFVLQGCLAVAVMRLIRRGARQADSTLDHVARARSELTVERNRLHSRRQFERNLHDTVLSTLTVVARGTLRNRPDLVMARCARDLELLDQFDQVLQTPGLFDSIAWEAGCRAMSVRLTLPAVDPKLPDEVSDAVAGAVRETLSNVERHAGVDSAELIATLDNGGIQIAVRDRGRGFDPRAAAPGQTGVRRSVVDRMAAVGGEARVVSVVGQGTEVHLSWQPAGGGSPTDTSPVRATDTAEPAAGPREPAAPEELAVAAGYRTGMAWALVVIALVWHVYCGWLLLSKRAFYQPLWLEVAAWLAIVVIVVWLAMRGPARPLPVGWMIAAQLALFAAAAGALFAIPGDQQVTWTNWVVGDVGWPLALVALHRPIWEYLGWMVAVIGLCVGSVLTALGPRAEEVDRIATSLLTALVLQLAAVVAYGLVRYNGALAEAAVQEGADLLVARESLAVVARDRHRWQREWGASLRPLVRSLAQGTAEPADHEVRGRCAIEASRLRAMLSELSEAGEHSVWRRDMVSSFSGAAADRLATLEARVAPDFGEVPEPVRVELVAVVLAILRMTSPGEAVVTLSGNTGDAFATVLLPVAHERSAVRAAVTTVLNRVRAAIPGTVSTDVEEPGSSCFWVEVRWVP